MKGMSCLRGVGYGKLDLRIDLGQCKIEKGKNDVGFGYGVKVVQ